MAFEVRGSRTRTAQPTTYVKAKSGVAHLWGTNIRGARSVADHGPVPAHGTFGLASPSTAASGNTWVNFRDSGWYLNANDTGTATLASAVISVGDSNGSGAPPAGPWTFVARVRFAARGGVAAQIFYGSSTTGAATIGFLGDNTYKLRLSCSGTADIVIGSTTLNIGQDYDIAVTWDGVSVGAVYVDGVLDGTGTFTTTLVLNTQFFLFGSNSTGTAERAQNGSRIYYAGVLQGVRSPAEIYGYRGRGFWSLFEDEDIVSFTSKVANQYTLPISQGTYSITGQVVAVKKAARLAAAQGTYSITGQALGIKASMRLAMAQGTYSLSGQTTGLKTAMRIAVGQGNYSITGQAVRIGYARLALVAAQGSYSITGQTVALRNGKRLVAAQGSYAITGQATAFVAQHKLTAAQGTYSITGQTATLRWTLRLALAQGTYTVTGQTATLRATRQWPFAAGSYSITGQSATVSIQRSLLLSQGAYAITGQASLVTKSWRIAADQGTYALSGQSASFRKTALRLALEQASYLIVGQNVSLNYVASGKINANAGTYAIVGQTLILSAAKKIFAAQGTYSVSGQSSSIQFAGVMHLSSGAYSVSGQNANLNYVALAKIVASQGTYSVVGQSARLLFGKDFVAQSGAYVVSGANANFVVGNNIEAESGEYTIDGFSLGFKFLQRNIALARGLYGYTGNVVLFRYSAASLSTYGSIDGSAQGTLISRSPARQNASRSRNFSNATRRS